MIENLSQNIFLGPKFGRAGQGILANQIMEIGRMGT